MDRWTAALLGLLLTAPALVLPELMAPEADPCQAAPRAPGCAPPAAGPAFGEVAPGPVTTVAFPAFAPPRPLVEGPVAGPGPAAFAGAPRVEAVLAPAPPVEVGHTNPQPSQRSFPVPPGLPKLPLCDAPLPHDELPPGMLFLVETRLPGQEPRVTPAVPFVWNPVDADGVLLTQTGVLGVDLLVQVLPDLTFGEFTVRIVRATPQNLPHLLPALADATALDEALLGALPDGGNLVRSIPAMEVRLVLALSGGPEPGLFPQGCERSFLAAGYAYDHGLGQPDLFEVVVDLERLDDLDVYAESRLRLEGADPGLDLLLELYDAVTYRAARARTLDVRATLHGLPEAFTSLLAVDTSAVATVGEAAAGLGLPPLPPPLDGLLDPDQAAEAGSAIALDWRTAARLPRLTVDVHRHDAASATDVRLDLAPFPASLSEVLTTGAATTVTHDASDPLDLDLAMDQWSRDAQGQGTLVGRTSVVARSVPPRALFHMDGTRVDYAGSAPLGRVSVLHGDHPGPFPTLPGDHFLFDNRTGPRSISLQATGVTEAHWRSGPVRAIDVLQEGGQPFEVRVLTPTLDARAAISALPSELQLRSDFAGMLRYRADAAISDLDVFIRKANLHLDLFLDRVPREVDAAWGQQRVELTLSEPLGAVRADAWFPEGLEDLPYDRVHAEAFGVPGLAASWSEDGKEFGVQALPPGSAVGLALVQLSSTAEFLQPPDEAAFVGAMNFSQPRATLRVLGLERVAVDLHGGVDLLYEAAEGVPLHVWNDDVHNSTRVTIADLPDRVRVVSDLGTMFSYEGSAEIATLTLDRWEWATLNRTQVEVHGIPTSLLLLLDIARGALEFDTGGATITSATVDLQVPAGMGDSGIRHGRVVLEAIPGVHVGWTRGDVAFRTTGGALGLLEAEFSSALPMNLWPHGDPDVDRVVFWQEFPDPGQILEQPADVPQLVHIHARVLGLREASARSASDRVVADVRLAEPRPFDVRYHREVGDCLTADVDLAVRDLPTFHVDTDLAGTLVYEASAPIGNVTLFARSQPGGFLPGSCQAMRELRVDAGGVPERMTTVLLDEPLSAWFDASGPIGAVGVDLRTPGEATQRILVNVTGIPRSLAASMDPAKANLLFEAAEAVKEVRVRTSTELDPEVEMDAAAFGAASAALVVRNLTDAQGQHLTTDLKLLGLRSAAVSLQQGAMEAQAVLAAGPVYLDLKARDTSALPVRGNQTLVHVEGETSTYNLTLLPDERIRLETDLGPSEVTVIQCDQGTVDPVPDSCKGNRTFAWMKALPRKVDVRLTGLGAELDLGPDAIEAMYFSQSTTPDAFDPLALRGFLALSLSPVSSGHARFRDPGDLDLEFARPTKVYLDKRTHIEYPVPFEDVHANPKWDLWHYAVGVWTEAPPDMVGLGRAPYKAVSVRLGYEDGEGITDVKLSTDSNPARISVDWNLPEFTFLAFSSPLEPLTGLKGQPIPAWPTTYLAVRDPPRSLDLTLEDKALVYPPAGYKGVPWAWDNHHPERITPLTEGSRGSAHKSIDFRSGGPHGGDLYLGFARPAERDTDYYEGTDIEPDLFFYVVTTVPEFLTFDLYTDPWVNDDEKGNEPGAYMAIDVRAPQRHAVTMHAAFPGDWNLGMQGDVKDLFFDLFRPFAAHQSTPPKAETWSHIAVDANFEVALRKHVKWTWNAETTGPSGDYSDALFRMRIFLNDVRGTLWANSDHNAQGCRVMPKGGIKVVFFYPYGGEKWTVDTAGWGLEVENCLAGEAESFPWVVYL